MKIDEIVTALRCISSPGGKEQHCERCPFYAKEHLSAEVAEKVGTDEWTSCDCDAAGFAAADLIENQQREIEALRQANTALRAGRKWIPVTERLPEKCELVAVIASGRPAKNIQLISAIELATLYNDGWCLETYPEWTGANVTHWMPLPEEPEVE